MSPGVGKVETTQVRRQERDEAIHLRAHSRQKVDMGHKLTEVDSTDRVLSHHCFKTTGTAEAQRPPKVSPQ